MRIAITGTRGIPNRYGGFENLAENLAVGIAAAGHDVVVYCPHYHQTDWKPPYGVSLKFRRSPDRIIGSTGSYLYDLRCLGNASRLKPDVILECGYGSAAPWYPLLNFTETVLITHMDGMEWQREKWSLPARRALRFAERIALKRSDAIIYDNPALEVYYTSSSGVRSGMIAYGADIPDEWDFNLVRELEMEPGLEPDGYFLLVARLEPENNILPIIQGFLRSPIHEPLVIVGEIRGKFASRVLNRFKNNRKLIFPGGIYEKDKLNNLRHFAKASFHGHKAGGTNPSLLEAMATGSPIIAHENPYNKWILQDNARYFNTVDDIVRILANVDGIDTVPMVAENLARVRDEFQWARITSQYLEFFSELIRDKKP